MGRPRALTESPDVVAALYEAFQRGDVDGIMACYADDVVFHIEGPEPTAGDHVGSGAVRALLDGTIPLVSGVEKHVLDTVDTGDDRVTVRLKFHLEIGGEKLTNTAVHMHRIEGALIAETWLVHLDEEVTRKFWDLQEGPTD